MKIQIRLFAETRGADLIQRSGGVGIGRADSQGRPRSGSLFSRDLTGAQSAMLIENTGPAVEGTMLLPVAARFVRQ